MMADCERVADEVRRVDRLIDRLERRVARLEAAIEGAYQAHTCPVDGRDEQCGICALRSELREDAEGKRP